MGVSVGVEETKEDKSKTAKSKDDEEAERECSGAQITRNKMYKSSEELKVRQKYKLNPVVFQ